MKVTTHAVPDADGGIIRVEEFGEPDGKPASTGARTPSS
jgi:hypothetical protein